MQFTGNKSLLASRAVWGGVIAILAGVAGVAGYAVSPDDQAQLVEIAAAVASALGGAAAVYGRVRATKAIK